MKPEVSELLELVHELIKDHPDLILPVDEELFALAEELTKDIVFPVVGGRNEAQA